MHGKDRVPALSGNPRATCVECRRRKKKCDHGQPCRNCARRYPPVDCVYERPEPSSRQDVEYVLRWPAEHNLSPTQPGSPVDFSKSVKNEYPRSNTLELRGSDFTLYKKASSIKDKENVKFCDTETPSKGKHLVKRSSKGNEFGLFIGCGTTDLLRMLSVEGTNSNAEFFYTHTNILCRFDFSIDGSGPSPSHYENVWAPYTFNSPIILHINLLKAALIQSHVQFNENNFEKAFLYHPPPNMPPIDPIAILRLKARAISMLNARLRSPKLAADDETIGSVCYLIYLEWCWSENKDFTGLMPHVKGVHEMLKIRRGLRNLGQDTLLARLVMLCHYHLATMMECDGFVCPKEYIIDHFLSEHDAYPGYESPLWISGTSFVDKVDVWQIHRITAEVLDQISFLTSQIRVSVFNDPPGIELSQIMLAIARAYIWISALPSAYEPDHPTANNFIYESVRLAAVVYCRALLHHIPLSQTITSSEVDATLEAISHIPLSRWKDLPGVWLFILLVVNSGTKFRREGQLSRALARICSFAIALPDWQTFVNLVESFCAVQKWISTHSKPERGRLIEF